MSQDPMSDLGLDFGISTMIRDEPGYRIRFQVEQFSDQNSMEMVLRVASNITWWKSLSYFMQVQGGRGIGPENRIETKDSHKEARQILFGPALSSQGTFELWKGGFMGFGAFAGVLPINAWANKGRRIIFAWEQD